MGLICVTLLVAAVMVEVPATTEWTALEDPKGWNACMGIAWLFAGFTTTICSTIPLEHARSVGVVRFGEKYFYMKFVNVMSFCLTTKDDEIVLSYN